MLSALLRPFQGKSHHDDHADLEHDFTPRPSIVEYRSHLHATADFTEAEDDDEESNDGQQSRYPLGGRPDEDEDGLAQAAGLLPLFSASHLGTCFTIVGFYLSFIVVDHCSQTRYPSTA